jgi:hypothetical protein
LVNLEVTICSNSGAVRKSLSIQSVTLNSGYNPNTSVLSSVLVLYFV